MTVTPRISEDGRRDRLGGSASKMNLLTPIGIGPTRRESSSWSCSELQKTLEADGRGVKGRVKGWSYAHEVADPT